ncbi:ABC transporter ATP-binding protein [Coleofasciculus sp. FACHB-T130]|uniref:ABC transporter ATP-binding protein n=1 Tax=Cyanophyceae TaxID=3028117 RepID=UPI001682F582|nr:ABC transporter ATP-binding protein [Coleofasciculus sp. FACHB-T130]MBD1878297.1 ABC transporter ATP-binding protein [Coleofasciculus sp. FACHB-T130]
MSEIAISLKNVSKCFKLYGHPVDRLKDLLLPGKIRANEFWALRDINLEVPKGQTLGIVGQNGSGKSTLLQIIAGTLTPTTGDIQVNGRVAALLELGSGFNPEFTGRQNVFFNGRLLGLSQREIEDKFDTIAEFAEIGDFIEQPVKAYSSGMFIRLAFAVAINVEPDILIVDEALSVGDIKFQFKCFLKFKEFQEKGITILFVSHDGNSVKRYCNNAILLNSGQKILEGIPNQVINHYTKIMFPDEEVREFREIPNKELILPAAPERKKEKLEYRYGDGRGEIIKIITKNSNGETTKTFLSCEKVVVSIEALIKEFLEAPVFAMTIKDCRGEDIYITNTYAQKINVPNLKPGNLVNVSFEQHLMLCPGDYFISFGFVSLAQGRLSPIDRRYDAVQIKVTQLGDDMSGGIVNLQSRINFSIEKATLESSKY